LPELPDLPGEIIKVYPPRGPLRQYRLAASATFACSRCGLQKTSKLVTVVDGKVDALLCNGCYGRLLSLWDVKASDLPDAERDEAILALLSASVTVEQVAQAQARLAAAKTHRKLSQQAQQMLATAEAVTTVLRSASGLDWSAAIIGLCKAVEVEVVRRVAEPLLHATAGVDLSTDLADTDLKTLARYCVGRAPPPALGALAHALTVAARSHRRAATSPLLKRLYATVGKWSGGGWIMAPDGLAAAMSELTTTYRNPAAHTSILTESDYKRCRALVQADGGILDRLVSATVLVSH
jgi:hypothetical protein